jgi:hypothetical protein
MTSVPRKQLVYSIESLVWVSTWMYWSRLEARRESMAGYTWARPWPLLAW